MGYRPNQSSLKVSLGVFSILMVATSCATSNRLGESKDGRPVQPQGDTLSYQARKNGGLRAPAENLSEEVSTLVRDWVVDSDPKLGIVLDLKVIDQNNLFKATAKEQPWSGSYWPDRIGGIAARYRQINEKMSMVKKPSLNFKRYTKFHNYLVNKFDTLTEDEINLASPAEKYDILMGDRDFTFSNAVWAEISHVDNKNPGLPFWSGICNGWTAASLEVARPRSTVRAVSPKGHVVNFYPDDLKGLVSFLWAHDYTYTNSKMADGSPAMVMYGLRCNLRRPKREKNGSVALLSEDLYKVDPSECRDINPGMWHLSVINRIGVQGKGFIMDIDYNNAVNNHVISGYEFQYFNPKTGKVGDFKSAAVPVGEYQDPFKKDRHPQTASILGVSMKVTYIDYGMPISARTYDEESIDKKDVMPVIYDLELDAQGKVVGGHWRVNRTQRKNIVGSFPKPEFPDFMWFQRRWAYSAAEQGSDPYLENHDWSRPIPEVLRVRAKEAALNSYTYALEERARFKKMPAGKEKDEAIKASKDYDDACAKYCGLAYNSPEANQNLPEVVEAKKIMDQHDRSLSAHHAKLDAHKIPRNKPYPHPLGRVIYGLADVAAKKDPHPPAAPVVQIEE